MFIFKDIIVPLAISLTTEFISFFVKKKPDNIEDSLKKAFTEGLKGFVNAIPDGPVDKKYIVDKLLGSKQLESLLISFVNKPSLTKDTIHNAINSCRFYFV